MGKRERLLSVYMWRGKTFYILLTNRSGYCYILLCVDKHPKKPTALLRGVTVGATVGIISTQKRIRPNFRDWTFKRNLSQTRTSGPFGPFSVRSSAQGMDSGIPCHPLWPHGPIPHIGTSPRPPIPVISGYDPNIKQWYNRAANITYSRVPIKRGVRNIRHGSPLAFVYCSKLKARVSRSRSIQ